MGDPDRKPLFFIASSWKDLKELPGQVQDVFGTLLLDVQYGETPANAKPLRGFGGAAVLELVEEYAGDAYRAVYTVKFPRVVYVLHVFRKKSKRGIATPKRDLDLVRSRYELAKHTTRRGSRRRTPMREKARKTRQGRGRGRGRGRRERKPMVYEVSDNIFADLGRPNADELLAKAELARAIRRLIADGGLTQAAAARVLGVTQPDVSNLHRGRLRGFSMERLYRFLNALGQDVQIVIQPKPSSHARATIRAHVRAA